MDEIKTSADVGLLSVVSNSVVGQVEQRGFSDLTAFVVYWVPMSTDDVTKRVTAGVGIRLC